MSLYRTFYTIEGEPEVELPLERPLFDPPEHIVASERPRPASMFIDDDALTALYDTFFIDETLLHENIERQLMSRSEITLAELVASYPIEQGVAELVAYFLIAAREPHHTVDRTTQNTIMIRTLNGQLRNVIVPRVIFRRAARLAEVSHV
jgi:hypothetical protein